VTTTLGSCDLRQVDQQANDVIPRNYPSEVKDRSNVLLATVIAVCYACAVCVCVGSMWLAAANDDLVQERHSLAY